MSEVVQLFAKPETIEDFINREGVAHTTAVAYRFGLEPKVARQRLAELAKAGRITCDGRRGVDWGAELQWSALAG